MKKYIYFLLLTVLLTLSFSCFQLPSGETPADVLTLNGSDPFTLDPALAGDATSHDYIVQIFGGLLRLDDNLQPVPDIAHEWTTSPDGRTYTFKLRDDVTFHNGRQLKAEDVKYSWERAVNPATASRTAYAYLGDIVGVKEMISGKASTISGVKILDDYTMQVTIDEPKSYFLSKLTYTTAFVVDQDNVRTGRDWWRKPVGTGPFKFRLWERQKHLILDRYDLYYGNKAKVSSVVYSILSGNPMNLYETDKIDVVEVSLHDIERASDQTGPFAGQLRESPKLSISYIGFNAKKPPFDDINIRLAFSHAIDKDKLVSLAFKDTVMRADGLLPPGMPGYNSNLKGIKYDVAMAKQLIAKSKFGSIDNLPQLTLTTAGQGGRISNVLEAVVYQWKQNLGVGVKVRALEPERYYQNLHSEIDEMFDFGWIADYPHPQDFLDILFHSGTEHNYGGYSNAEVDALLGKAGREQDINISLSLYQEVEQKLVNDAAALPLYFDQSSILVKPYVNDYVLNPLGYLMLNNVSISR